MKKAKIIAKKRVSKVKNKESISKKMTVGEVVSKYPKTVSFFLCMGLYCVNCPLSSSETLEQMAKGYGLDLEKLLKDLNDSK